VVQEVIQKPKQMNITQEQYDDKDPYILIGRRIGRSSVADTILLTELYMKNKSCSSAEDFLKRMLNRGEITQEEYDWFKNEVDEQTGE
jgi:hypothetical protein